jgi:excisionase family DNA binding protein
MGTTDSSPRLRESVSIQRAAEDVLDVSESTVRRLVAAGEFPGAFRVGRLIRIPRSDLVKFKRKHGTDL